MIVQMDKTPNSTSKERAQQLYNKNIELEKKRQKSLQAKVPSDPNAWYQIRENYEAIILEDYAFAEKHNVEFSLWQLHYKRIEEFRGLYSSAQASGRSANTSGRAPLHPERISKIRGQFKAFLSEATGFYHDLILKIKAKYGLPLGHFNEDFDNEAVMGTENAKSSDAKKALVSCHRCLIYLGDLARYKGLYGEGESRLREFSAASSYYMQAAYLWPSNGNPHHQLAILSTYSNDELVAVYRYFRSLALEVPFATAKENLLIAFEKNRQSYTQLIEATKATGSREDGIKQKYKEFCTQFVRLHGILFTRTSLETFAAVLSSVRGTFLELLSSGPEESLKFGKDVTENGLFFVRLVAILIFTVFNASKKSEGQSYAEILQHNLLCENARSLTFEVMSLIVERSVQLLDPSSSFLLPGILVFLEWLASCPDFTANPSNDKKQSAAESSFWKHSIALFNKLLSSHLGAVDDDGDETCFTNMSRYVEGETENRLALLEDFELRGFLPLLPAHSILDFSRKQSISLGGNNKEKRSRVKRIIAAGRALASIASVDHKPLSFDSKAKQFVIGVQLQAFDNAMPSSYVGLAEPHSTVKEEIVASSVESMMIRNNVRLSFEGDDEGEEIVFRPAFSEKQIDVGTARVFPDESKQHRNIPLVSDVHYQLVTSDHVPPSAIVAPQRHPVRDVPNSPWLIEQQTSLADRINNLRFVENNHELKYESKGNSGVSDGGSYAQPSASLMNTANVYSDYRRAPGPMLPPKMDITFSEGLVDVGVNLSSLTSAASRSQSGRPIRRLGPPPGFSAVPPKHVSMPMSSMAGTNGSLVVDDYRWLDGYHMPSSSSSIVPNHASVGGVSLGNSHLSYMSSSNGNSGLPFPGMQSSALQLQGGNLNSYSEYQSFRNMNLNHGQKLLEQQHVMTGNHQFTTQAEHYHGQSAWNGQYRV